MAKNSWSALGTAEEKVIGYLATFKDEKVTDIAKGLEYGFYNTVVKAVRNLVKKDMVKESSSYKSEKGRKVKLYALTPMGVMYAMKLNIELEALFKNYSHYAGVQELQQTFKIFEEELNDKWTKNRLQITRDMCRVRSSLYGAGFTNEDTLIMGGAGVVSVMFAKMGVKPKKWKRILDRLVKETGGENLAKEMVPIFFSKGES
jgi:DNA-binding MarR family transcriptional regulator